ncbi:MAG: hypothetical protein ACO1NO_11380 [Burkholderiaceae bacterium]
MQRLFPGSADFPEERLLQRARHEWIAPAALRRDKHSVFKKLPAGKPDCLRVEIQHGEEGTERCTAAVYGDRAYVIHYELRPRVSTTE